MVVVAFRGDGGLNVTPRAGVLLRNGTQAATGLKLFLLSGIPYRSLLVMSTATVISYVLSRQAVLLVTGDRWGVNPKSFPEGYSPDSRVAERIGADDRLTLIVEVALGITFMITCVFTLNLVLMAFALALLLGLLLLRESWNSGLLRPFLLMPFVLVSCWMQRI